VSVGGSGVDVGVKVAVGGTGVRVGVLVGFGVGVLVGEMDVWVGVLLGGTEVAVGGIGVGVCAKTSGFAVGPQAVASSRNTTTDSANKCFLIGLPPYCRIMDN
jgi:hypothetical protein